MWQVLKERRLERLAAWMQGCLERWVGCGVALPLHCACACAQRGCGVLRIWQMVWVVRLFVWGVLNNSGVFLCVCVCVCV